MAKGETGVEIKAFADAVQAAIQQSLIDWLRTHSPV